MKKITFSLLFYFLCSSFGIAQQLPYWCDMNVFSVNKESPRTSFMTYDTAEEALTGKYANSNYYRLLNGTWKFYYVDGYKELPEDPVGVYRREISVPEEWMDRDIYLHIAAAKSGVYVYLNGQEVGYSEDSKNPAEFRINPYIQKGVNTLVVKMFRWSTGSYLESQDFWRLSGFERDVFLWSQPKTAIQDFSIVSTLDDSYQNGIFGLDVDLRNTSDSSSVVKVGYQLLDKNGKIVIQSTVSRVLEAQSTQTVNFNSLIVNVAKWSSEHPNLYKLLIVNEKDNKKQEVVPFNVGFRRI